LIGKLLRVVLDPRFCHSAYFKASEGHFQAPPFRTRS
jgi:hypothetical protein